MREDFLEPYKRKRNLTGDILYLFGSATYAYFKGSQGHCQTNLNRPAKGAGPRRSGRQLTPLGQGGGTVLSEDVNSPRETLDRF